MIIFYLRFKPTAIPHCEALGNGLELQMAAGLTLPHSSDHLRLGEDSDFQLLSYFPLYYLPYYIGHQLLGLVEVN